MSFETKDNQLATVLAALLSRGTPSNTIEDMNDNHFAQYKKRLVEVITVVKTTLNE